MIHVIFTEENSTGSWLKTVMILLLYRANFSLCLINWSISVQPWYIQQQRANHTIDTWDNSILAFVRENDEEKFIGIYNFSENDKLHGSMKKMVCTQILSPDVRWKPKVCRFLHSDAIGCAEINNNF